MAVCQAAGSTAALQGQGLPTARAACQDRVMGPPARPGGPSSASWAAMLRSTLGPRDDSRHAMSRFPTSLDHEDPLVGVEAADGVCPLAVVQRQRLVPQRVVVAVMTVSKGKIKHTGAVAAFGRLNRAIAGREVSLAVTAQGAASTVAVANAAAWGAAGGSSAAATKSAATQHTLVCRHTAAGLCLTLVHPGKLSCACTWFKSNKTENQKETAPAGP